jgi:hypothetical protein
MNTNLLTIVKQIAAEYGEGILADPQRLKAFFGDLAKDEPKPLRIAFGRCVEAGAYTALKAAPDVDDRTDRKAAIVQRLRDEHGLDPALCTEALDILDAVLFADIKTVHRCTSCGGELREEWKLCPFCGTAIGSKRVEDTVAPPTPHIITPKDSTEKEQISNNVSNVRLTASDGSLFAIFIIAIAGALALIIAFAFNGTM